MRCLFLIGTVFLFFTLNAQHSPLYSQYMYNTLLINPAYAGSNDALDLSTFYRAQWRGIEGAPENVGLSAHAALKNKSSNVGLTVINNKFGINSETHFNAVYAYKIKSGPGFFSFGLSGGICMYKYNFENIHTTQPGDPSFAFGNLSRIQPETGFGIHYRSRKLSIGISAPVLFSEKGTSLAYKPYITHFIYVTRLNEELEIKTAGQLKYLKHSPIQAELSGGLFWRERIGLGLGIRTQDSFILYLNLFFNEQFSAGYSYDYTISLLKNYSFASQEISLRYFFGYKVNSQSSRYF